MTNSRVKGKAGELEAAHYLAHLFRQPVRRGQQFRGGADSPDVIGLEGLHIEVKRVERLNLDAAMEQSARETAVNEVALVIHRTNRKRWKFSFYADDLLRFLDAANSLIKLGHISERPEPTIQPNLVAPCGAAETSNPQVRERQS
jgi:hypothetical protein